MHQYRQKSDCMESNYAEKALEILEILVNQFRMNQRCALEAKEDNSLLDCVRNSITNRRLSFPSVLVKSHLEYCVQF